MATSIFENCEPWPDIVSGKTWYYTSDLLPEDASIFFQRTYPAKQLRELIKVVFSNFAAPQANSGCLVCIHAPPGAGKTHALKALTLLARMPRFDLVREFAPVDILPGGPVRLAVIDGEKCDLLNGIHLEDGLRAYTPWGHLAYQLAGKSGFEYLMQWDRERIAPPRTLLRDLLEARSSLIVLDRIAVLWRRFAGMAPQLSEFICSLGISVASSPRVALVYTLATRKIPSQDPYYSEHSHIAGLLHDARTHCFAQGIAPEHKPEMTAALRRFLFKRALMDSGAYPVETRAFDLLISIVTSLGLTHVFGGILAVLGRTSHNLWKEPPGNLACIGFDHLDLRPLAERLAYDRWEMNGRPQGSAQSDIEHAKRVLQRVTNLADRIEV